MKFAVLILTSTLLLGCASNKFNENAILSLEQYKGSNNDLVFSHETLDSLLYDEEFKKLEQPSKDLFSLTHEQKEAFKNYYFDPKHADIRKHTRFGKYLTSVVSGFSYRGETYTAQEAFLEASGNCLSLAIMTTALAELAGLEISYQKVNSRPIYAKHGNILLLSSHVVTKVYEPDEDIVQKPNMITIRRPHVVIDYFPTRGTVKGSRVEKHDFVAMYYQNKAAKALLEKDYDEAYAFVKKGLRESPSNPETLNLLGVLYKNVGLEAKAEQVYATMMKYHLPSLNTIENYAQLLKRSQQFEEAEAVMLMADKIEDENPYRWITLAQEYLTEGNNKLALKYATKAKKMAPYLHESHFIIAQALLRLKGPEHSMTALNRALDLADSDRERSTYSAKIYFLKTQKP
jgi:Tfp pilus assembly protein PilF